MTNPTAWSVVFGPSATLSTHGIRNFSAKVIRVYKIKLNKIASGVLGANVSRATLTSLVRPQTQIAVPIATRFGDVMPVDIFFAASANASTTSAKTVAVARILTTSITTASTFIANDAPFNTVYDHAADNAILQPITCRQNEVLYLSNPVDSIMLWEFTVGDE